MEIFLLFSYIKYHKKVMRIKQSQKLKNFEPIVFLHGILHNAKFSAIVIVAVLAKHVAVLIFLLYLIVSVFSASFQQVVSTWLMKWAEVSAKKGNEAIGERAKLRELIFVRFFVIYWSLFMQPRFFRHEVFLCLSSFGVFQFSFRNARLSGLREEVGWKKFENWRYILEIMLDNVKVLVDRFISSWIFESIQLA